MFWESWRRRRLITIQFSIYLCIVGTTLPLSGATPRISSDDPSGAAPVLIQRQGFCYPVFLSHPIASERSCSPYSRPWCLQAWCRWLLAGAAQAVPAGRCLGALQQAGYGLVIQGLAADGNGNATTFGVGVQ
jgi:hypothetical protein